jgi:hypothetical protein
MPAHLAESNAMVVQPPIDAPQGGATHIEACNSVGKRE